MAARLHSRLRDWFFASFPTFTHAQLLCVPSVLKRESILLTSPTGSGKTLAGFLGIFDSLLRELDSGDLKPGVPPQAHLYFVRRASPRAAALLATLRGVPGVRQLPPAALGRVLTGLGYRGRLRG